jgi:hypothetical protein
MPYILGLFGIYILVVALHGNAKALADKAGSNAVSAGGWLVGWLILLVMAKIWRPFYYIAILALITYILEDHSGLFTNLSAIWSKIEGSSKHG